MGREGPSWGGVLEDVRRTMTPRGRESLGLYSIEGIRLHERALRSGTAVERAVASESLGRDPSERIRDLLEGLEEAGCRLHFVPDVRIAELTEGRGGGPIVGLVALPAAAPPLVNVMTADERSPAVALVAVDVEDPGNIGALVRTALVSGASALVAVGISDPFHPRAVRTAMGSHFKIPIFRYEGVEPLLDELDRAVALKLGAVSTGGTPPQEERLVRARLAVFLGSEAFGLPAEVCESMDRLLTVPMRAGVDSYSVNAVAAILLYEIGRQGREAGPGIGC
jgi:TrmH family RNA methyltransferase